MAHTLVKSTISISQVLSSMDSSLARYIEVSNGYLVAHAGNEHSSSEWNDAMEDLSRVGKELHDCRLKKLALTETLHNISQGQIPQAEANHYIHLHKLRRTSSMDMPDHDFFS